MDIRKTTIKIFSNSSDIRDFLKHKNISNYRIFFNPINSSENQQDIQQLLSIDSLDEDINILILNTDFILDFEEKEKWLSCIESYNYVFLYGNYNCLINRNEFDINFKSFDNFKEFFEIFYYLFNGVDMCSIYIEDILNILGSRPYGLKIFTLNTIKEILEFLKKYTSEINELFYIEKSTYNNFDLNKFADDIKRIENTVLTKITNKIFFPYTYILSEENDECWIKLVIV